MLNHPAVMITVVICAFLFGVVVVTGVVFLVYTGHDTAALSSILAGPILAYLGLMSARLRSLNESVKSLPQQGE